MSQVKEKFNPLLACCQALLHIAMQFHTGDKGASLALDYRDKIMGVFDELEHQAYEKQIPLAEVQHAKFALVAFMDEVVLSSVWPGRAEWMGKPLQLTFFGEHLAGERFFERLSELRQTGAQHIDVLEIYYVCLQLGFEGMYRMRGLEQLMALQVDLRSQIDMTRGLIDPQLSPNAGKKTEFSQTGWFKFPLWVVASVTLAVVFFVYSGYSVAMNKQANKALVKIEHSQKVLEKKLD